MRELMYEVNLDMPLRVIAILNYQCEIFSK